MIKNLSEKKKKGFTLVELIVVIAIIGILAAIAVPKYSQYQESAKINADKATAKMIADATLMAIETGDITEADLPINSELKADEDNWGNIKKYISGEAAPVSGISGGWNIVIDLTSPKSITVTLGSSSIVTESLEY